MKTPFFAKAALLIFLTLFSLIVFFVFINKSLTAPSLKVLGFSVLPPTHSLLNFDADVFYRGVNSAKGGGEGPSYKIYGGVVPHHNLASSLIAKFFLSLREQSPKVIILLGPNHRDAGKFNALTGSYGWETPFGILESESTTAEKLVSSGLVQEDDEAFNGEQSVGAVVPYIKYFLPGTKIVPIILKSGFSYQDAQNLAGLLTQIYGDSAVVLASVDFSHHLTSLEAKEKDRLTLAAVKNYDLENIFSFNSNFLDSPGSLVTLLLAMKNLQKGNLEILNNANSGEITGNNAVPTTSYFLMTFH